MTPDAPPRARPSVFSLDDAILAGETWGANCGPSALAAMLGWSLDAVRPYLIGFDEKRYTNPTMMFDALKAIGVPFSVRRDGTWPTFGLARVQWEGPWTRPGVPMKARYRQTHWVGSHESDVFDMNCICVGGWVSRSEWSEQVVPWLLKQVAPKADGRWHLTHSVEIAHD